MSLKQTAIYNEHLRLNARMVSFAGWEMPVSYDSFSGGMIKEHLQVREKSGIFDVSHMGEFWVCGKSASEFLNRVCTRPVTNLANGKAQYCLILNEKGGIIDDIIVYKIKDDQFWVVVNAANIKKDFAHFQTYSKDFDLKLEDVSPQTALIAIQGPEAISIVTKVLGDHSDLKYYHFKELRPGWLISRTGYTGEDGFEVFCPNDEAPELWNKLIEAGSKPIGLGARDSLRTEVGFPLYGSDLRDDLHPHETLSFFAVKKEHEFLGSSCLQKPARWLPAGFVGDSPKPFRPHEKIYFQDKLVGEMSSGSYSPGLKKGVGLGFLCTEAFSKLPDEGTNFLLESGQKRRQVTLTVPPFVDAGRAKKRKV